MTANLEFSVFDHGPETIAQLRKMLAQLEKDERIKVNLVVLPWQEGWERMVNVALYGEGFDVSEIGSTWVGDFIKMEALSSFSPADARSIGQEKDFLPASWSSGVIKATDGRSILWSIPWSSDTRVIYYRRDLLKQAGIEEKTAFRSPEQFEKTLEGLKKSGVEVPLTLPMGRSRQNVHNLAVYVWGAGGGFLLPGGRKIIFDSPESLAGMKNFFRLGNHLVPQVRQLGEGASENLFTEGIAAVTISGTWVPARSFPENVRQHMGTALIPGVPWVGGSNFAIWKNCRYKREAVRMIQYLTNSSLSDTVFPSAGLPTRLSTLDAPLYTSDAHWKVMREALLAGRAFPTEQLWGLVESRLTELLPVIWDKIFAEPETDIETILGHFIPALSHRLSMTLSAQN